MKKRIAYVIFNKRDKTFASSKTFVADFSDCRIYKEKHHAVNRVNVHYNSMRDHIAIVPIEVTLDPYDEFSAIIGVHDA
jgi:hypothetical protein